MTKQLRYVQIAAALKTRIQQGVFPPGSLLPSHKELAEQFDTSMMTARQALHVLAEEGLVSIVHGSGTYVSSSEVHGYPLLLQGFQNDMDRQKVRVATRTVSKEYDLEHAGLSKLFHEDTTFCCLTRIRILGDRPIILQRSYTSDAYRAVIESYSEKSSLYQSFSERTGNLITRGQEIVVPVIVEGDTERLLGLSERSAAFRSRRLSFTMNGKAVIFDEAYLLGSDCFLASNKQGRSSKFKYIINTDHEGDVLARFEDPDLWEDLL